MNVIIFSKDRAAQLDLLLRSMPQFDDVYVLWTASNNRFYDGYDELQHETPDGIMFIEEFSFKDNVVWYANSPHDLTMFLTDDDVFINDMEEAEMTDNILCLSLRLNPRMNYCYTLSRSQKSPKMTQNGNTYKWNWMFADADYGYPMSLDGHIFRTTDILPLLEDLKYKNPNTLEGQLARHPINRPMMLCYENSAILNNPINRVQTVNGNRHGTVTAEYLNDMFLKGKRICLDPFIGYDPNACHVELPIEWE